MVKQETHRPGALKQTNKAHKTGRHRSKGSISSDARGKISVKSLSKRMKKNLNKDERRHQAQQIRSNKRREVFMKKRNILGAEAPPNLIAIVPLHEDLDVDRIVNLLTTADEQAIVTTSTCSTIHISLPRFKQRYAIVKPPICDYTDKINSFAILDIAKVATTILFVASAVNDSGKNQRDEIIDSWGEMLLQSLVSQGLTTRIMAVTNIEKLPIKKRQDFKNNLQKLIHKWLPDEKVMNLDSSADAFNVLRRTGFQKQKSVIYREKRSFLLAEHIKFNLDDTKDNNFGVLEVSGFLRGKPLSVNGLVHIPGFGDYQMIRIDAPPDPFPLSNKSNYSMDEDINVLETADPKKQESLESENVPDPMDAEQTWPTKEELAESEKNSKIIKRVPKGTSEYQSAWIPDEDAEELGSASEEEEEDDGNNHMAIDEEKSDDGNQEEVHEEYETISEVPNEHKYDEQMDLYEEKQAILKLKEAKTDARFPDEIDTPQNMFAKDRFQKYRGLESFRTSPWDPKENLPYDYARIFQFENFDRTRRRIFKDRDDLDGALPGWYITIHIAGVSKQLFDVYQKIDQPLIVFGMLENEHKMSVLNFVLKRTNNNDEPIQSKERLVFQCGFRRFSACPIFSQHTNGNKHKYERFFQPNSTVVATVFAPITFPPSPVICYSINKNHTFEIVATGSLLSVDPNRLIIKRVILSGHPFKVNKQSAVIRFMFFYREDIKWFSPVKLRTKYGRRGHIKEPLGTHGHMKCVFDGQLKSQDTILMNLYKRVFPKWNYEPLILTGIKSTDSIGNNSQTMEE